jgi:hypothetical protein
MQSPSVGGQNPFKEQCSVSFQCSSQIGLLNVIYDPINRNLLASIKLYTAHFGIN